MLALIATVFTIALTLAFFSYATFGYIPGLLEARRSEDIGDSFGATIALTMVPFGLAVSLFLKAGLVHVFEAYDLGGIWASPYVMSVLTAKEYWNYFILSYPSTLEFALANYPLAASATDIVAILAFLLGTGLLVQILSRKHARQALSRAASPTGIVWVGLWLLAHLVATLIAFDTLLFLAAHVIGTLMFVTGYWWVPIVVLILAGMGGGKVAVYNKHGKKVGEIDRDAF